MRTGYILFRLLGYSAIALMVMSRRMDVHWAVWALSAFIAAWCVGDQGKRHDSPLRTLRKGIYAETVLIVVLAGLYRHEEILYLLFSPMLRSCVHLPLRESCGLIVSMEGILLAFDEWFSVPIENSWGQMVITALVGSYALFFSELYKHKERLRRMVTVSDFEKEVYAAEQERIRVAGELHDLTGQFWIAVVRALDVALHVEEPQRQEFISKARKAALDGLNQMRESLSVWHNGRKTPSQWMNFLEDSVSRFRDIMNIEVELKLAKVNWSRLGMASEVAEAIARISIESMTNAVRHGKSTRISILLDVGNDALLLKVSDNGIGTISDSPQPSSTAGIGTKTMENVVQQFGGEIKRTKSQMGGTMIEAFIPMRFNSTQLEFC
ncbi:ATP-binding protein [Cohnella lubricantis]